METDSWRNKLKEVLISNNESFEDIVGITMSDDELDYEFYSDYGLADSKPFIAWTKNNIYFSKEHDGKESVGVIPRNPVKNIPDIFKERTGWV